MDQQEILRRLALALAIGLLIGLERGWQTRQESDRQRTAGLRTFALTGLFGGTCGLVSAVSSPVVLAAGLVCLSAVLTVFTFLEATAEKNFSATGVVAGSLTFMLGAYATLGNEAVAAAAAVAMAILLALRDQLHSWVRNITWPEMRSVLMLLAMSFLFLPILPNRTIDPWDVLNPAAIWLLAILIAAISFAGYVAIRALGERAGIAVAAIAGAFASSTAVTVSFSRLAREQPQSARVLAGGVLLAGVVMSARIVILAGLIAPDVMLSLIWPLLAAALVQGGAAGVLLWNDGTSREGRPELTVRNPFEIGTVLQLSAVIAVIMVVAKIIAGQAGNAGVYVLAAVSGIADVDALTLSMTRLAGSQVSSGDAATAILIAAAVNTASKSIIAASVGGRRIATIVGTASALAIVALVLVTYASR